MRQLEEGLKSEKAKAVRRCAAPMILNRVSLLDRKTRVERERALPALQEAEAAKAKRELQRQAAAAREALGQAAAQLRGKDLEVGPRFFPICRGLHGRPYPKRGGGDRLFRLCGLRLSQIAELRAALQSRAAECDELRQAHVDMEVLLQTKDQVTRRRDSLRFCKSQGVPLAAWGCEGSEGDEKRWDFELSSVS